MDRFLVMETMYNVEVSGSASWLGRLREESGGGT